MSWNTARAPSTTQTATTAKEVTSKQRTAPRACNPYTAPPDWLALARLAQLTGQLSHRGLAVFHGLLPDALVADSAGEFPEGCARAVDWLLAWVVVDVRDLSEDGVVVQELGGQVCASGPHNGADFGVNCDCGEGVGVVEDWLEGWPPQERADVEVSGGAVREREGEEVPGPGVDIGDVWWQFSGHGCMVTHPWDIASERLVRALSLTGSSRTRPR